MDKDFRLIWKMKRGDEAAMDVFVRKYYPILLKYCQYHMMNQAYAEDIVQETFVRFFQSLTGYQHHGKLLNYLYRIAANLCTDYYRKHTDCQTYEEEKAISSYQEENQMKKVEEQIEVERALEKLPYELREIIILYYFQELKLKEIARLLDIGLPLVKYRMKRAKEQLKTLLGKEEV